MIRRFSRGGLINSEQMCVIIRFAILPLKITHRRHIRKQLLDLTIQPVKSLWNWDNEKVVGPDMLKSEKLELDAFKVEEKVVLTNRTSLKKIIYYLFRSNVIIIDFIV